MGNLLSQTQPTPPLHAPDTPDASSAGKRKRTPSPTSPASNASDIKPLSGIDATPDGDVHRFIVRCPSIFWCTRKDIARALAKIPRMPPYGGLHKITRWDHFFITFPNKACAEQGVRCLNAYKYRGKPWEASAAAEHSSKRRRIDNTVRESRTSGSGPMDDGVCKTAAMVTAKWRDVAYEEQLKRKTRKWTNALSLVTKEMRKELRGKRLLPWLDDVISKREGKGHPACCSLVQIVGAESERGRMYYRNKNEFTVGVSPDACGMGHDYHKSTLTIGYALGLVRDGQVFIGRVDEDCVTTSKTAREIAQCLAPAIEKLGLQPYDKRAHEGYWRQVTCREGTRTGQVLVSVVVNPSALEENGAPGDGTRISDEDCQKTVIGALRQHFGMDKELGIFWQPSSDRSAVGGDIPAIHLHGISSLHEEMCGLKFRIQPTAFFQVNTFMAERLYNLIGDLAEVDKETVVFDVCCGTGTIGLSLARRAHSVVGIEMNESAVADAQHNAKLNGIDNATFIAGKVENRIYDAIQQLDGNRECVVILDPPRAGLPMNVVSAVRAMGAVRRIVYVACEPNNFWRNALGFCRPRSKAFRLEPFRPVKAYGLDLFPHTDHGELVVLLERDLVKEEK
ncbi:unnamed protein product [Chondrus crispus]|uniref:tRNA (Uracil-5-)-methyltransferase n=1 Tax=Chondrus crispus TaxID=2769 RepID=R7Q1Y3_CHOCR|nr:unnamed protein product [Chondrus crispus]CDF32592.1 unnamed protein product [Chondrus crispus]|eukprot:XP_005712363.1 unnamed protein product [Chondrus crispus]